MASPMGMSPGDFYFIVKLIGTVIESFGHGPRSAVSEYSTFAAEFDLISTYLDGLPSEQNLGSTSQSNAKLRRLWGTTKSECLAFVVKYSSLATVEGTPVSNYIESGSNGGVRAAWTWFRKQSQPILNKVQWPLLARDDANALQQKLVLVAQSATLDMGISNQSLQKRNFQHVQMMLNQVLMQNERMSEEASSRLRSLSDDIG